MSDYFTWPQKINIYIVSVFLLLPKKSCSEYFCAIWHFYFKHKPVFEKFLLELELLSQRSFVSHPDRYYKNKPPRFLFKEESLNSWESWNNILFSFLKNDGTILDNTLFEEPATVLCLSLRIVFL